MLKNTDESYGWISRLFHWLMALMVVGMLCVGTYMAGLDADNPAERPLKISLSGLHKATGIVILLLVVARISWAWINIKPALPATTPAWQIRISRGAHLLLYVLMFFMPLTGYLMTSYAARPVSIYGLFELPTLSAKNMDMAGFFHTVHGYIAYILIAVILLHFAAALKHHFIDKDRVLKRMLTGK